MPTPVRTPGAFKQAAPVAQPTADEKAIATAMTPDAIMKNVEFLAKTPRVTGSPEFGQAATWVVSELNKAGWDAKIVDAKAPWGGGTLHNVVAERKGTAADADRKLVLAGAHLDSVPRGPGANDDGSGSATLLEIAKALNGHPTANDVRLMWFDGEERGLWGSTAYAKDHASDMSKAVAMINMDMVASPHGKVQFSLGSSTPNSMADAIKGVANRNGLSVDFLPEHHNRSDHASFDRLGVPSADFGPSVQSVEKEDPYYHRPTDTPDKLNKQVLDGFSDVLALTVYDFAGRAQRVPGVAPKDVETITGPPK
jgi:Zn-dependent M28 family amino/carboxypeptidase